MFMPRPRVRIRYRKFDDLRFVGHQDLVRAWDRWLRRADVRPALTEGFHPRPRLNFPSALPVGIAGENEVLELELIDDVEPSALAAALAGHAPPGLEIVSIERMGDGVRFSQPAGAVYEADLPAERVDDVRRRIDAWNAATDPAERSPATILGLEISAAGTLRMELRLGEAGAVRPRDLLAKLELSDLETAAGVRLVRTRVDLHAHDAPTESHPQASPECASASTSGPPPITNSHSGDSFAAADVASAVFDSTSETT